jgi:hypothetical protein
MAERELRERGEISEQFALLGSALALQHKLPSTRRTFGDGERWAELR